ncbi:MAG: hypothetical protein PHU80_05175 [Kiritimatiellae bacterium]|nr:hypothetical protein [Kiritimatiellia bacterium]
MNKSEQNKSGTCAIGCHACFAAGMAVAMGGFVLIWSPWTWLMLAGAATSCVGTCLSAATAWRLAGKRRNTFI